MDPVEQHRKAVRDLELARMRKSGERQKRERDEQIKRYEDEQRRRAERLKREADEREQKRKGK